MRRWIDRCCGGQSSGGVNVRHKAPSSVSSAKHERGLFFRYTFPRLPIFALTPTGKINKLKENLAPMPSASNSLPYYPPSVTFGRRRCSWPAWKPLMEKSLCLASSASVASTTTGSDGALQGDVLFVDKEKKPSKITPLTPGRVLRAMA